MRSAFRNIAVPFAFSIALFALVLNAQPAFAADEEPEPFTVPSQPSRWAQDRVLDWGPLKLHSGSMLHILRLGYTPGRVRTLRQGELEIQLPVSHFNQWGQYAEYFHDGEWTRYGLRFAFGIVDGLEFFAELPVIWRGGGVFDGFIEGFHDFFGITQTRRDQFPKDQLVYRTETGAPTPGTALDNGDEGLGVGDVTFGVQFDLLTQRRFSPGISMQVSFSLPTGPPNFGSGSFAALLALQGQLPLVDWFQLFAAIGPSVHGSGEILNVKTESFMWFWFVAGQFRVAPTVTITLQFLWQSEVAQAGYQQLGKPTHELNLGVQWEVGHDWRMEFALTENINYHGNTPDFGIHLGFVFRIR